MIEADRQKLVIPKANAPMITIRNRNPPPRSGSTRRHKRLPG
jgi:hypothetical protein